MKKFVQFLFLMALSCCVGLTAHAQRVLDVLANPSFELSAADTPLAAEYKVSNAAPVIYGWTLATVGTQFNNTEILDGESSNSSSQFGTSAPSDGEYSLFFRQGWNGGGNVFTLTSDAIETQLAAGSYTIAVDYKQQYSYDNDDQRNSNTKVSIALVAGEETIATATSGAAAGVKGGGATTYFNTADWSTLSQEFTLDEPVAAGAKIVITLNAAGARRSDFFIDNVVITYKMNNAQIEDAYNYWREKNLYITGLENQYPGEIATSTEEKDGVMDKMNAADKLLAQAQEELAAGDDSNVEDLVNQAIALIDEAVADADENLAAAKALPAGEYIFKTTVGGKTYYLAPANAWGTRASIMPHSVAWQLAKVANGVYTLESVVSNGNGRIYLTPDLGDGQIWSDGAGANIYFTENADGTYALSAGAEANYFVLGAAGYMADSYVIMCNGAAADALKWTAVSTAKDKIAKYDDVTFLIKDADFGRNNRNSAAWTINPSNDNKNMSGGTNENRCAESYGGTFTLAQTIEGVPNGYYTMTAQGFYRHDWGETIVPPYFYINDAKKDFPVIDGTAGSMNAASADFAAGKYVVSVPVNVTDGKITLGAVSTQEGNWNIWDTFTLKFMGDDITDYNETPYAELNDALAELVAKRDEAATTLAGYPEYAQKAVEADVKAVNDAIGAVTVTPATATTPETTTYTGLYKAINDAYTAKECATKKDAILADIKAQSDAIDAYLKKAKDTQDANDAANDELTAAYEDLVAQWQDAYDKINTKYKEYIDNDNPKYTGYLKQLNSIQVDVDALEETIEGYNEAGTAAANKEKTLETINGLSEDIDKVLQTALNTYNDEVADANQTAYNDLMEAADEMIEAYKDAIKIVNKHYAKYHPEAAKAAQVALFELYDAVRAVKSDATEEYTAIEAGNKEKFDAEEFPLDLFDAGTPATETEDATGYYAALEAINIDGIDDIIAQVEADAQQDVYAKLNELQQTANEYQARAARIFNQVMNFGLQEKYGERGTALQEEVVALFEEIRTYVQHHPEFVYSEPENEGDEPEVIGVNYDGKFNCLIEALETIQPKIDAVKAEIEALEEEIAVDASAAYLEYIIAYAEETQAVIDEKKADLATYAEDIQTEYAGKYDAVAEELAAIVEAAKAADAAGELDLGKAIEFFEQIGDEDDVPVLGATEDGPLAAALFHKWTGTEANAMVDLAEVPGFTSKIGVDENEEQYEVAAGQVVYGNGNGSVNYLEYANLTAYKTMTVTFAEGGAAPRFLFNRMTDGGATIEINSADNEYVTASEDGLTWTIDLNAIKDAADGFCNLDVIKASWGGPAKVASVELESAGLTNNTIYQKIYAISVPVENEAAYDADQADLAEYKARLEELNATIEEFGFDTDELTEDPEQIEANIGILEGTIDTYHEDITLAKKDAEIQQFAEEMITEPMDADFDDIFRADLIDKLADVKTTWNTTYASQPEDANFPGSDITNSEVWDMIVALEEEILNEEYTNRPDYEEAVEKINTMNIIFTDYDEWVKAATQPGDGNIDGQITLADIIIAAQNALNADEEGKLDGLKKREAYANDANGDGVYTEADIVTVVNLFLAQEEEEDVLAAKARVEEIAEANDYLVVDGNEIALENTTTFVAFTIEATTADNSIVKVEKAARAQGLTVMTQKKNGYTRIVGFSTNNTPIEETTGLLLTADSDVTVTLARFTDAQAQAHVLTILTGDEATAIAGIEAGKAVNGDIYAVNGAKLNALQKGINIVKYADGSVKKILVK